MSDFFTEHLKVATEEECKAPWSGGKGGKYFRCSFCGYKLRPGDKYRIIYTNDMQGAGGNPIVCEQCNAPTGELRQKWFAQNETWKKLTTTTFWWFLKRYQD